MGWAEFRVFKHDENPLHQTGLVAHDREPVLPRQNRYQAAVTPSPAFSDALVAQLPGLRRYAMALAGNAALADDLVQDCIERALGQQAQLREVERDRKS